MGAVNGKQRKKRSSSEAETEQEPQPKSNTAVYGGAISKKTGQPVVYGGDDAYRKLEEMKKTHIIRNSTWKAAPMKAAPTAVATPLAAVKKSNVTSKVYHINERPKDDASDEEWEEIPMEEEVVVTKTKAKTKAP